MYVRVYKIYRKYVLHLLKYNIFAVTFGTLIHNICMYLYMYKVCMYNVHYKITEHVAHV